MRRHAKAIRGAALTYSAALTLAMPATLLGACSSDVNPVKAAFVEAGYGPKPVQAPEFVEKSRREDIDFMPVGVSAPKRSRARNAEGQKSLQAELEGARSRNEARGRAAEGAAKGTGKESKPAEAAAE